MRFMKFALLGAALVSGQAMAYSLSKIDAAKLAMYRANNEKAVVLTVAAKKGAAGEVASLVKQFGGRVDYRHDKVDFLAVVLPLDKVNLFVGNAPVESIDVDNLGGDYNTALELFSASNVGTDNAVDKPSSGPWQSPAGEISDEWPPKLGAHNLDHPYSILKDLDGEAFRQRNPGNDGRGVVIAHVEWFPDFLSPELQVALDKNGKPIPKFADVINIAPVSRSLDATAPREGAMWSTRLTAVTKGEGTQVNYEGKSYRTPKSGRYRMARMDIEEGGEWSVYVYPLLAKHYLPLKDKAQNKGETEQKDDAKKGKNVLPLAILWSDSDDTAWIDTNGDNDFSDEQGVKDYRQSRQFGVLGQDDPATAPRETIGYSIQKDGDYLSINIGFGGHASTVAGAAAGSRGTEGKIEGVAPGAQFIVINCCSNDTMSSYARSLVVAFTDPRTDVVLIEGHSQITGNQYELRDGRAALSLILSRLVDVYKKPTFMTGGNAPGMTTIMDTTIPANVISVGAYQSAASVFANHAIKTRYPDDLHWVGSEGPSGLGALKPDFLSPANPMSLQPRFRVRDNRTDGIFELPPGYGIGGGTSTATPVATGTAALLIGAAKREGLPRDAETIHRAFRNTARFMPQFPAYKQGRGVIQLDAAWKYLQAEKGKSVEDIEVLAPVRTATSALLSQPNTGTGLFEREGWRVGDRATRTLTLTRKSGPNGPLTYDLSWEGEQKAFTTAQTVTLPLNKPVQLKVEVAPTAAGVHSSILQLKRSGLAGAAASIPATVVVPTDFSQDNHFAVAEKFDLERPGRRNLFFRVPEEAQALSVNIKTPRDKIAMQLYAPDNRIFQSVVPKDGQGNITVDEPMSGVWQAVISDRADAFGYDWNVPRGEVLPTTAVTVQASLEMVETTVTGETARFENRMAGFTGGAARSALAGMRTEQRRIRQNAPVEVELNVEEGTEMLVAQVDRVSGADLDVDLHLFDCTGKDKDTDKEKCAPVRRASWYGAHERAIVERPKAGKWKVLLMATGSGEATVSYSDAYTHPKLGALSVTDSQNARKPNDSWETQFNVWRAALPRQGYKPVGLVWVNVQDQRVIRGAPYGGNSGYELPLGLQVVPLN